MEKRGGGVKEFSFYINSHVVFLHYMEKITRKYLDPKVIAHATDKKVLDIGAGANSPYAEYFPNRVTVDIKPERNPDIVGDITNLPIEDNSYEFILCTEVIEHVWDFQTAIKEMHRILKPGGTCILTTRFLFPIHEVPDDYWRFSRFALEKLFEDWSEVKVESETKTFSAIGALIQRIMFQTHLKANKLVKLILLFLAWVFDKSNWLIKAEYGHISREKPCDDLFTTGYFVSARKK